MRVLLVHNFYQIPGGEDTCVRQELSMLEKGGIEVELYSVDNDSIRGPMSKLATAFGVVYNPVARRALAKKLKVFLPDVVHIHNFFPLLSPSVLDACRAAGIPAVMTLHNYRILSPAALLHPAEVWDDRDLTASCWRTVASRVYRDSAVATLAVAAMIEFHKRAGTWRRKVDRFIALTEWARRMFIAGGLPAERIVVKPNCVQGPLSFQEQPRHGALFVGRVDAQKGIEVLLDAWKDLDYPLKIIGDGPLSALVSGNDRVTYLGRQPRDVVQREMRAAQFLVLPSLGCEMHPVTILEAFANRLPVIYSDLPSLGGLVESGMTGLRFSAGDAATLASQVRWAIAHPVMVGHLGRRARTVYEQHFAPEVNLARLLAIYRSVCPSAYGSPADDGRLSAA